VTVSDEGADMPRHTARHQHIWDFNVQAFPQRNLLPGIMNLVSE
jgi:hypothetical protein